MAQHFQLYKDKAGEFRWRLVATNGQIIAAASEGYSDRRDCKRGIEIVKEGSAKYEVYEDKAGEFRWRCVATNGNIIATSGEGYVKKTDCETGCQRSNELAHSADIEEIVTH